MVESATTSSDKTVRHFRQILVWPLQLMPIHEEAQIQDHCELLEKPSLGNIWREVLDEFEDPAQFKERHYNEFVAFLPYVQRFLYGEGAGAAPGTYKASPMRVFRRSDVCGARVQLRPEDTPITLSIAHIDLIFFYDIDVVILNVEVFGDDIPLPVAHDLLYKFGRAYPAGWEESGQGSNCPYRVEWLDAGGKVLGVSDYEKREKYLSFVCKHRAPHIGAHWACLMRPLVLDGSDEEGIIRYRQIEYYRMPAMGYLAMDNPRALSRNDFVRLGMGTGAGPDEVLPFAKEHAESFESQYCYDRYWGEAAGGPVMRFLCSGRGLVVVGESGSPVFMSKETGALSWFRHQHFLLFMIAHMQRAALLMFSNRLVDALDHLKVHHTESVKEFKRIIRQNFEIFLRFTHRYWFHEVSEQAQMKALFKLCTDHLGTRDLYDEVKEEIHDMDHYLDTDSQRRQNNTVTRLTVVTSLGLIGTVVTGLFGMNVFDFPGYPAAMQWFMVFLALLGISLMTFYTMAKSKRLSDFLDALSDERLSTSAKLGALLDVWRKPRAS